MSRCDRLSKRAARCEGILDLNRNIQRPPSPTRTCAYTNSTTVQHGPGPADRVRSRDVRVGRPPIHFEEISDERLAPACVGDQCRRNRSKLSPPSKCSSAWSFVRRLLECKYQFLHPASQFMNTRQLKYFCEVVEAGSAALAASRLFVAPTAISAQVSGLEETLGGPLFDRATRPMALTALGKFFYPRARELVTANQRLEDETRGIAAGKRGWIGIAFVRSSIFSLLPGAVQSFRRSLPQVHIDLVELLSEYQPAQLRSGRIDVGISRFVGTHECPPDLHHTVLFEDAFLAAVPIGHKFSRRSSIRLEELSALPFINYPKSPQSMYASHLMASLVAAGAQLNIAYEAIEIHTALGLVAAGQGLTLAGASVAANNRMDIAFIPISDFQVRSTVLAVSRANDDSKLVSAFLQALQESPKPPELLESPKRRRAAAR